mmetsp:Transcript_73379/g.174829  ORF Transcript_73379/g.174829 Transcript_73379/m.174829 type:complete len:231 (+) Transcript_73379:509-1201(+)
MTKKARALILSVSTSRTVQLPCASLLVEAAVAETRDRRLHKTSRMERQATVAKSWMPPSSWAARAMARNWRLNLEPAKAALPVSPQRCLSREKFCWKQRVVVRSGHRASKPFVSFLHSMAYRCSLDFRSFLEKQASEEIMVRVGPEAGRTRLLVELPIGPMMSCGCCTSIARKSPSRLLLVVQSRGMSPNTLRSAEVVQVAATMVVACLPLSLGPLALASFSSCSETILD